MLLDNALTYLTIAAWIVAIGFLVILFIRTWQDAGFDAAWRRVLSARTLLWLLIFAISLSLLRSALVFIQPFEAGVVVSLIEPNGYRDRPLRSGLNLVAPLVTYVYRYPIAWQTYTMSNQPDEGNKPGDDSIAARTSDGQQVYIDLSLIYSVNPEDVVQVYVNWQDRYREDFIRPLLRGVVRAQVSQFTAQEVNSRKRQDLERDLSLELGRALDVQGFIMERFLLRNIAFSPEYSDAIEMKQIAEQEVITTQYRAQQTRNLASGEAEALALLGAAIKRNPDVITLRYVDKLAEKITVMLLPANSPYLLPLPNTLYPGATSGITGTITPTPGAPFEPLK